MDCKKFNTNYKVNSRYNMNKIRRMVNAIMEEDVNPQTLDFLFRYNSRIYPKTYHAELDLPGEFDEVKDTVAFIINGTAKQLDYFETVSKGGIVKRDACVNAEQQKGKLKQSKVEDIFNYCLYGGFQEKRLCYPVVVTDYDYGKEFEDYEVEGRSFRIYFRIFNKEKIDKMLNTLKEKDFNKYLMTNEDYVRFIFCLIFANDEFSKQLIEELTCLFATIEKISSAHQMGLFLALKMMIKFRFGDDLKIKEELLEMIIKSVQESKHDELNGYEVEQKSTDQLKADYAKLKAETDKALSEKDDIIESMRRDNESMRRDNESMRRDNEAMHKDKDIIDHENANMRKELEEKNKWIRKAEKALEKNHIFI